MARFEVTCSDEVKELIGERSARYGFNSVSPFVVFCCLNASINVDVGTYPLVQNLQSLKELKEAGIVNEQEFELVKADILERKSRSLIDFMKRFRHEK